MRYSVITESGLIVYESSSEYLCRCYVRQAEKKGAAYGSLSVVRFDGQVLS